MNGGHFLLPDAFDSDRNRYLKLALNEVGSDRFLASEGGKDKW